MLRRPPTPSSELDVDVHQRQEGRGELRGGVEPELEVGHPAGANRLFTDDADELADVLVDERGERGHPDAQLGRLRGAFDSVARDGVDDSPSERRELVVLDVGGASSTSRRR